MAMITCEECGEPISDRALSCPLCGCPAASDETLDYFERRARLGVRVSAAMLGVALALLALGFLGVRPLLHAWAVAVPGVVGLLLNAIRLGQVQRSRR